MVEMARRLSSTQYVLVGILFGTCVYLWTRKLTDGNGIAPRPSKLHQANDVEISEDVENMIDDWAEKKVQNVGEDEPEANHQNVPDDSQQQTADVDKDADEQNNDDGQMLEDPGTLPVPELKDADESSDDSEKAKPEELLPEGQPTSDNKNNAATESEQEVSPPSSASVNKVESSSNVKPFAPLTAQIRSGPNHTLGFLDLWNGDLNCTKFEVNLLEDRSLEKRALVSFPGSGNSWLRMLLMGISGVFINSVYPGDDAQMQSKANVSYQVPTDCGCTLLQKTHDFSLDAMLYYLPEENRTQVLSEFKGKGVLIIRNPFSAIPSYRNFDSGGMQGKAPETAFQGTKWDNFVARSIAAWETLATVWIRGLKQGGIIYYEKLKHEMPTELVRLTSILGLPHNQERLDCVLRHAGDNSFKRTKTDSKDDVFTASQRILIHKAIENVQAVLKEKGFDPLPTQYYDYFSVIPEYGIVN